MPALPAVGARAPRQPGQVRTRIPWSLRSSGAFALPARGQRCDDEGASRNQYGPSPLEAAPPGCPRKAPRSVCRRAACGRAALARKRVRLVVARTRLRLVRCVRAAGFVRDRSGLGIMSRWPPAHSLPRAALAERAGGILSIAAELLEPPIRCVTPGGKNVAPD